MAQPYDVERMMAEMNLAGVTLLSQEYNYVIHMYDVFMIPPVWEVNQEFNNIVANRTRSSLYKEIYWRKK